MNSGATSTRQEILNLLKARGPLTVEQLSQYLGISPMGVRQHLIVLEREGLIIPAKKRQGTGRPAHLWHLTPKGEELFLPRRYGTLAASILQVMEEMEGEEKVRELLRRWMKQRGVEYRRYLEGLPLEDKVFRLAKMLDEEGFMATANREEKGWSLTLHNCILFHMVNAFPYLCQLTKETYLTCLDVPVEQRNCIAHGGWCCSYFIPAPGLGSPNGQAESIPHKGGREEKPEAVEKLGPGA